MSPSFLEIMVLAMLVFACGALVAATARSKGIAWTVVLTPFLILFFGVVASFVSLKQDDRPNSEAASVTGPHIAEHPMLATTAARTPPATVLDFRGQPTDEVQLPADAPEAPTPDEETTPDGESSVQPVIVEYTGQESVGRTLDELPSWVNEPSRDEPGSDRAWIVLSSGQYATIEEAETDLIRRARPELEAYLTRMYPAMAGWQPSRTLIRNSGVIARRVHQTRPLRIGQFEEPMHRVFWMLELRPEHRDAFFAAWRPQAVRKRLTILGGAALGLTLLLGGMAVMLRREPRHARSADRAEPTAVA